MKSSREEHLVNFLISRKEDTLTSIISSEQAPQVKKGNDCSKETKSNVRKFPVRTSLKYTMFKSYNIMLLFRHMPNNLAQTKPFFGSKNPLLSRLRYEIKPEENRSNDI